MMVLSEDTPTITSIRLFTELTMYSITLSRSDSNILLASPITPRVTTPEQPDLTAWLINVLNEE
jgi:hypothetical protein